MMNIKIVKLLAITVAVLIAVILAEWIISLLSQKWLMESESPQNRKAPLFGEIPAVDLKGKPEDSYADLVARPLFIKGRRPVDENAPEQSSAVAGSGGFDWQLNGVYTTEQGVSALFSRVRVNKNTDSKDRFRKLKENDDLDGWRLAEIQNDKVLLKQDDESKELLLRKPKPKELPKTAVKKVKGPDKQETDKQKRRRPRFPVRRRDLNKKPDEKTETAEDSSENTENEE